MAGLDPMAPIYTAIAGHQFWVVAGIATLAIATVALKLWLPGLKGAQGEAKVGRVLDQLFGDVLHDIIIPDGRGGSTQIDHVALTPAGLLAIETKNYSGAILGREREAQWMQRLRGRSYRFQDPLRQNYLHVSALQALQLGVPVQGHVVFTNRARFPKGIPQGVSQLRTMRQENGVRCSAPWTTSGFGLVRERSNPDSNMPEGNPRNAAILVSPQITQIAADKVKRTIWGFPESRLEGFFEGALSGHPWNFGAKFRESAIPGHP